MFSLVYTIFSIATIVITIILTIKCFLAKPSNITTISVLFFVAILIIEAGFIQEFIGNSTIDFIHSLKIKYIGICAMNLLYIKLIDEFCHFKIHRLFYLIQSILTIIYAASIATLDRHDFFISNIHPVLVDNKIIPSYNYELISILLFINILITFVSCLLICIISYRKSKSLTRKRIGFLVGASLLLLAALICYEITTFSSRDYTMFFLLAVIICMYFLFIKYDYFDSIEAAIANVVFHGETGLLVIDKDGEVMFANDSAKLMLPELNHLHIINESKELTSILSNKGGNIKKGIFSYIINVKEIYEAKFLVGYQFVINDTSALQQKIEELKDMTEEANRANKTKSNFLANMSHEIRTPLNAILGMNEMILRESTTKEITKYANNIHSASNTLLSIINDILDLSKVESGKMTLVESEYKLSNILNDVTNIITPRANKKGLSFNIYAKEDIPNGLIGDEIRLRQILINIINNGIKYTEKGSVNAEISYRYISIPDEAKFNVIHCETLPDSYLEEYNNTKNNENTNLSIELIIDVKDTGIGIKEEDLDNIFNSFQRLDEKRNKKIEGTGLGLSIANNLVGLMNGAIIITSTYGKGSTFSIHILQKVFDQEPIGDIKNRISQIENNSFEYKQKLISKSAKILIVDDNEMNLSVATNLLKDTRLDIDTASSGKECINNCKNSKYHIIFLDQMMPELDGPSTLKYLKENDLVNNATVIALTADAISGAREKYIELGFNDYLSKPISYNELENALLKYLPAETIYSQEEVEKILKENKTTKESKITENKNDMSNDMPTILVIDDSPYNLKLHKENLSNKYKGTFVKDDSTAEKFLKKHNPDYILKKYKNNQ